MPISIVLRTDATEHERSLTFDGARVVIGRGAGSDVRLPDPSVSHRHALVEQSGAGWVLVDQGSSNGTFVGGVKLSRGAPRMLRNGDLVRVGRVWLEIRIDQAPPTRELAIATKDLAMQLVAEAMEKIGDDVVTKVRVVEGRDRDTVLRLAEEGRVYLIGRAEACDLALADADASREHVRVVRRASAVLVRDLRSKGGTFVGEEQAPVDRDLVWKSPAMMRAGKTVLALEEPVQLALERLESAADEVVPEADAPPPPSKAAPSTGVAPVAQVAPVIAKSTTHSGRSATDWVVGVVALAVIGISIAGLVWLLKP